MTNVFIAGGGGSGVGSDDCTATAADVRKGKTFVGADTNDETGVGTLDVSDFDLDGTAAAGDVLSGKTFYSDNAASKRTGTLSLSGTAATSDVLSGKTFYNNDAKSRQTGTIPSNSTDGTVAIAQNTSGNYCVVSFPYGYYPRYAAGQNNTRMRITNASLASAIGLIASKVAKGMTIIGVTGTYTTPLSGNAAAGDVLAGKTFYSSDAGTKLTGTLADMPSGTEATDGFLYQGDMYYYIPLGAYTHVRGTDTPGYTEVKMSQENLRAKLGIDYGKVLSNTSILGAQGTLTCQSIVNFKAAKSGNTIVCTWQLPARGPLSYITIMAKNGSYPENTSDGKMYQLSTAATSLTLDHVMSEVGTDVYIRVWSEVKWTNPGGYLWWESKKTADAHVNLWENWMSADSGTNIKWGDGDGAYLTGIKISLPSIGFYINTPSMQLSEGSDVYNDSAYGYSQTSGATYMSVDAGSDGKRSTVFDNRNLKIVIQRNDDASKYAVILISTSKGTTSTSARLINFTIRNQYFNNSTVSDFTGGLAGARYRLWIRETDA